MADVHTFTGGEQPAGTLDTGSRHYEGPVEKIIAWKCPACGTDQTSDFALGCPTCGAGTALPRHVGVPPVGKATYAPALPIGDTPRAYVAEVTALDAAFDAWVRQKGGVPTEIELVLREAWTAAVRWYQSVMLGGPTATIGVPPAVDTVPMPRALLKMVIAQLEVVTDMPDDQQSTDLLALIAQLKELLES